jgi:response regulator RpfG family c-di-GMP phosphodiesterase
MSKKNNFRQKILIVDDSEMNRDILSEMLGSEYDIVEAEDGAQAVAFLNKHSVEISLVLLDIVMPVIDGYEVLAIMNNRGWMEDIPVIMISAENSPAHISRAYELGVTDFICRPFDASVVRRRVDNTILLYAKQKKLIEMVSDQIYEKEKHNNLMVAILSHIVEFRNGESGLHIFHVQTFTEILLRHLVQITDKYDLSTADITLISTAAALHDIGKISIPDEILNKPGRLTDEEFEIMKTHSAVGADMLSNLPFYQNEPLIKVAYDICRHHHERYDGKGYPDGLKGDDIPISAQIVSIADVYDALTSDRVYKKAFSHEKAMDMILNGECGTFNPILIECLKDCADSIKVDLAESTPDGMFEKEKHVFSEEIFMHSELSASERTIRLLEYEHTKNDFYETISTEILFEYTENPPMVTFSSAGMRAFDTEQSIINPAQNEHLTSCISTEDIENLYKLILSSTPENPMIEYACNVKLYGKDKAVKIICRSMWSVDEPPVYLGVVGKCIEI